MKSIGIRFLLIAAIVGSALGLGWRALPFTQTVAAALAAPAAQDTTVYIVQQGDTLSAIARRFGTTVTALIQLNGLTNANRITVGQRLLVPASASITPTRVTFAAGQTIATYNGVFTVGGSKQYILNARIGQIMDVSTSGDAAPVRFTIKSPDGAQWAGDAFGMGGLGAIKTLTLPQNGDYLITLTTPNAAPATNFTVLFEVTTPSPTGGPVERITFAAGATEAAANAALLPGGSKRYLLNAVRGQTMVVTTAARSVPVAFMMQSPSGTIYAGEPLGSEIYIFSQTVVLPESGDYLVTLNTPPNSAPTLYTIRFQITGVGGPTPTSIPELPPQRVTFAPGATSVTLNDNVAFPQRRCYVLNAQAGQEMTVQIASPRDLANFLVSAVNIDLIGGFPLKRLENEERTWRGPLPATTDYLVCVATPSGAVNYSLTMTIPPLSSPLPTIRLQFPRGGTSATVNGQASNLRHQCYILGASAHQQMEVTVTSTGNVANFSLVGEDGTPLKRADLDAPSFSGQLPLTQDYTICVSTPSDTSTVPFRLFVSITS